MLKILALGDVVGTAAIAHLRTKLWSVRSSLGADYVIANGENPEVIYQILDGEAVGTRFIGRKNA